jgi:hypothetical protein
MKVSVEVTSKYSPFSKRSWYLPAVYVDYARTGENALIIKIKPKNILNRSFIVKFMRVFM